MPKGGCTCGKIRVSWDSEPAAKVRISGTSSYLVYIVLTHTSLRLSATAPTARRSAAPPTAPTSSSPAKASR